MTRRDFLWHCENSTTTASREDGSIIMALGIHRTKDGENVLVTITADGQYMLRYADGRITII